MAEVDPADVLGTQTEAERRAVRSSYRELINTATGACAAAARALGSCTGAARRACAQRVQPVCSSLEGALPP